MASLSDFATNAKFKERFTIKGATHNDAWMVGKHEYFNFIKTFLYKVEYLESEPEEDDSNDLLIN
jgi:hypothetical protein